MTHLRINLSQNPLKEAFSKPPYKSPWELTEQYTYIHPLLRGVVITIEFSLCYLAAVIAYRMFTGGYDIAHIGFSAYFYFASLSWISIAALRNLYIPRNIYSLLDALKQFPLVLSIQFILISSFVLTTDPDLYPFPLFAWNISLELTFILSFRAILFVLFKYRRLLLKRDTKVLVIGTSPEAQALFSYFHSIKMRAFRFGDQEKPQPHLDWDTPANFAKIQSFCAQKQVNELIVESSLQTPEPISKIQAFADNHYMHVKWIGPAKVKDSSDSRFVYVDAHNHYDLIDADQAEINFVGPTPIISFRRQPLNTIMNRMIKRSFDIVFSLIAIACVLLPAYVLIGCWILWESPGPIIFRQTRAGRRNTPFTCFKFRTMYHESTKASFRQATKNDARITRVGAFLRRTNLDELPQLWNVLLGDMSLVGPRPHPIPLNDQYALLIDRFHYRHFSRPGITGWAQVHGYRGETKDPYLMEKRVECDQWYIEHWSLWLDIRIMFFTLWRMLEGDSQAY